MKITHRFVKQNPKNLKRNELADCKNCMYAEKVNDLAVPGEEADPDIYLCHAALYDIATLSCFVPKETE